MKATTTIDGFTVEFEGTPEEIAEAIRKLSPPTELYPLRRGPFVDDTGDRYWQPRPLPWEIPRPYTPDYIVTCQQPIVSTLGPQAP